jgi:DNA-binding NarL/FixJ family response regulator
MLVRIPQQGARKQSSSAPKDERMASIIRVLVADDHSIVRKGVIQVVRELYPAAVIEEANDGEEALQKCLAESWHLVIMDISMPKVSGLEVLRQAKPKRPELCVLMFSMHVWPQHIRLAFKLGASGFVGKNEVVEELAPAIKAVLAGKRYISVELAKRLGEDAPEV